jgi:uncharacterized membrane protein
MAGKVVAIEFEDEYRAREALIAAARMQRDRALWLEDAALAEVDSRGRVRLRQTRQPSPTVTAIWAGAWGWMIGLLLLGPRPSIAIALISALAGALWAGRDLGIPDELMRRLGGRLTPGRTTTFFLIGHASIQRVLEELERFEGRVVYPDLPDRIRTRMEVALSR